MTLPQYQPLAIRRELLPWVRGRFQFAEPSEIAARFNLATVPPFTGKALHVAIVGVEVECSDAEVLGGIVLGGKLTILVDMPPKPDWTPTAVEQQMAAPSQMGLPLVDGDT